MATKTTTNTTPTVATQNNFMDELVLCARRAVPLTAVNTIDVIDCYAQIQAGLLDRFQAGFIWNSVTGIDPVLVKGSEHIQVEQMLEQAKSEVMAQSTLNPVTAAQVMNQITVNAEKGVKVLYVMLLADRIVKEESPSVVTMTQQLLVMRETLKKRGHMLVLLGNMFSLPRELTDNFVVLSEALPSVEERLKKVERVIEQYTESATSKKVTPKVFTDEEKMDLAEAVSGSSVFGVEQALYLSMNDDGISLEKTLAKKLQTVSQTEGLSILKTDGRGFDSMGGLDNIKTYFRKLLAGNMKIRVVVQIEEIR